MLGGGLFDYILLAMALYVLYSGIRGKGRLYNVENIKEGMEEQFISMSRKIYIALGALMIVNSGASLLRNTLYSYEEVAAATASEAAKYDWVPKQSLGQFSFLTPLALNIASYIAMGITLVLIVVLIVKMRKMIDKNAQPKAASAEQAERQRRQAGHTLPVSAFEFDDEPTTDSANLPTQSANDDRA